MFIEQPPLILRWLYPRAFWRMDKNEKAVYLTSIDRADSRDHTVGTRFIRQVQY